MKPDLKLVEDTGSDIQAPAIEPVPQQAEMPFAIVDGEPVTELPRDLYIPPDALQVFLEAFEGPLDLLLYLIRKQNLDILDIPIAEITRQYMGYIDVMQELQLELAGEYLLMAAMLAEIKSRMLLPRPPSAEGQEEEDPRAELVRRLQEYERFKKAAEDIDQLPRLERDALPASAELTERRVAKTPPQVSLDDMLSALKDVLQRANMFAHHHVQRERLSVRQRMTDVLTTLKDKAFVDFTALFRPEEGRMGVTVTFIALLELVREGLIEIVQAEAYAPIHVRTGQGRRQLTVVASEAADAENEAALSQPELPDENVIDDDEPDLAPTEGTEFSASDANAGDSDGAAAANREGAESPQAATEPADVSDASAMSEEVIAADVEARDSQEPVDQQASAAGQSEFAGHEAAAEQTSADHPDGQEAHDGGEALEALPAGEGITDPANVDESKT